MSDTDINLIDYKRAYKLSKDNVKEAIKQIEELRKENLELKKIIASKENQGVFSASWMQNNFKNVVQEKGEVSISLGEIINPEELKKQNFIIKESEID